jgi:hypothetical protein
MAVLAVAGQSTAPIGLPLGRLLIGPLVDGPPFLLPRRWPYWRLFLRWPGCHKIDRRLGKTQRAAWIRYYFVRGRRHDSARVSRAT